MELARKTEGIALAALAGAVILFFASKWVGDGAYFLGDIITFTAPMEQLFGRALRTGSLALWSSDLSTGYPAFANGQVHMLYLPHLLMRFFLTGPQLVNISLLLHGLLAVWGSFLLLRRHQIAVPAAVAGALLFMFGGSYSARFGLFNFVTTLSWLPILLWLLDVWIRRQRRWALPALAGSGALFCYSGNPQAAVIVLIVVAAYIAVFLLRTGFYTRKIAGIAAVGASVCLIAAPIYLSVFDLVPATDRGAPLPIDALLDMSFPPRMYQGLLTMHPFGHADGYTGPSGEAEMAAFMGIGAMLTAGYGILQWKTHRRLVFFSGLLIVFGILLSLGEYFSVSARVLLFKPLAMFANPARYFFLVHVGISLLAGAGLSAAIGRAQVLKRKGITAAILLFILVPPAVFAWTFEDAVPWQAVGTPQLAAVMKKHEPGRVFGAVYLADNAPHDNFGVKLWNKLPKGSSVRQTFTSPYQDIQGIRLRLAKSLVGGGHVLLHIETLAGDVLAETHISAEAVTDGEFIDTYFDPIRVDGQSLVLGIEGDMPADLAPRLYIHTDPEFDPTGHLESCKQGQCQPVLTERGTIDASFTLIPTEPNELVAAHELLGPNVAAGYGIPSAQWTGALPILEHETYRAEMESTFSRGYLGDWRQLLNRLGVTHVISVFAPHRTLFQFPDMVAVGEEAVGEAVVRVFENPEAFPRVHFVREVLAIKDAAEQIGLAARLPAGQAAADISQDAVFANSGDIWQTQFDGGRAVLHTASEAEEFLVVRDTFLSGWQAYIDDQLTPIFRTDGVFRGMIVPAGTHTVVMRYEPAWVRPAVIALGLGVMLMIGMTIWARRQ